MDEPEIEILFSSFDHNKFKKRKKLLLKKFIIIIFILLILLIILFYLIVTFFSKNKINKIPNIKNYKNILNKSILYSSIISNISTISTISNISNISNITNISEITYKSTNLFNFSNISIIPKVPKPSYQLKDFQKYVSYARQGKILYEENLKYSKNPKISVIIALYNGEKYINDTLKSAQNQKMKDIEIIIVDDFSKDNSVKYVEEAQKKDPRISLYKNKKNMGCLYSKSLAALKTRGKYIILIDNDDLFLIDDLFDTLYNEIEKINFDIIEYRWIESKGFNLTEKNIKKNPFCVHKINEVISQPKLRRRFNRRENGKLILPDRYIWGKIIKRKLYVKAVETIGEKDLQRRVIIHDDTIITFFLFKYGNSFKKIDKIGLVHFIFKESASADKQKFSSPQKHNNTCLSYINYIELIYKHSENDTLSREEAFYAFEIWNIKSKCKYYKFTWERSRDLAKKFYNDPYINSRLKIKVKYLIS